MPDLLITGFLVLVVSFFAYDLIDFSKLPYEDAAILMRYAENFANGYGIVWNIGEEPVDGATDFLFMIVVGLGVKAGLSVEGSAQMIGFISHVLTVVAVYGANRNLYKASVLVALISALYLAVGPGLLYVAAYFGTPLFALSACVTWWLALLLAKKGSSHKTSLLFAFAGLITGLIRPEGVILAVLMLLAIAYLNGLKQTYITISYFIGVFVFAGGLYFLWRWQYFGSPLPNPFYVKGGGYLHFDSLKASTLNVIKLCLPFLPAYILALRSTRTLKIAISSLIPIVGFTLSFALLSDEMNFEARFQYAVLPIVLISWFPLVKNIHNDLRLLRWCDLGVRERSTLTVLVIILSIGVILYPYERSHDVTFFPDGRYEAALILAEHSDEGYTIATSEAGLLPLYSHWRAIDTYGLNDQWIAHNGEITTQYLDRYKPEVIMFNREPHPEGATLADKNETLERYVEDNGYILAAVFGDRVFGDVENPAQPFNLYDPNAQGHYYYVRSDFPDSEEIISSLGTIDYYVYTSGVKSINYALVQSSHDDYYR